MDKTEILNVLQPGKTYRVDAVRYAEVRARVLDALPEAAPGLTPKELTEKIRPLLDPARFPEPEKAGWWVKAAQLDLEARGLVTRSEKPPVRLWKTGG